ncbi:hypothetical protein [Liquorilactobacillus cacaonum]|uniref:Sugar specific permease n=1 Tax=Liquorilactobacillus cacaonum DSM 21116 TaxID=1423729 RepID=A0A0R2CN49_9LACO|nr:hypothetical protein [Liquorilactobacillus cacaonum]KRM92936.1 hypothetical protein FC80_GL000024 [Liquorilactobacillus cacaonum DSM 21116]
MQKRPTMNAYHHDLPLMMGYFIFSIILNSFGNALTVSLNLGSALWTAAAVNIAHATSFSLSFVLILEGVVAIAINLILVGKISPRRIIGYLIFMFPFAYLVGILSHELEILGIRNLPIEIKVIVDCLGIVCVATAISIYQRVNLMLHPCDDMMQIIRFKFFKGNSIIAQLVSFLIPIVAIFLAIVSDKQIFAINIGTIFSLLFQGYFVGLADYKIAPSLKHRNLDV